ncbi:MAG: hydrogenase maturation protein HypF, partial [Rhodothermales bacterium]
SMADFPQCEACVAEVADSANRRFHSQTNACPDCGPTLIGSIDEAAKVLAEGRIVALKAAGGFQLLCALRNPEAIARLRQRKHRGSKPFSRMYRSIAEIASDCLLSKAERELLASPAAPIALLRPRVTADTPSIGAMLPSTALHHLLLDAFDGPVIATSGNLAGEPIAIANDEAQTRLAPIADYFLMHTRPIIWPLDDSIAMIIDDQPMLIRRARGFRASLLRPDSISPGRLGLGGQLKNTVALSTTDRVLLSPHIGELDSLLSFRNFERQVSHLLERQAPTIVVCDRHPDYRSSLFAETLSLPVKPVQHHIAHARAGIAEHGLRGPVLAVVWDGTGLGDDGQLWGGEWFLVDGDSYTHVARLRDFPLPGGELAIREPRRSAFGLLHELDLQLDLGFTVLETRIMKQQIAQSLKCPRSSAVGRLFDAVSALLGIVRVADYEGHAAIMLEHAISLETLAPYPMSGTDWAPMIQAILEDLAAGTPVGTIANRFHRSLVALIVDTARDLRTPQVLLTGGCFQNRWLLTEAITGLRAASFKAYWPQELPPNDGGLAYGQLACV